MVSCGVAVFFVLIEIVPDDMGGILLPGSKRASATTVSVSYRGIAHVHTRNVRFGSENVLTDLELLRRREVVYIPNKVRPGGVL